MVVEFDLLWGEKGQAPMTMTMTISVLFLVFVVGVQNYYKFPTNASHPKREEWQIEICILAVAQLLCRLLLCEMSCCGCVP